jgi:ferredoxin-NADP reductase
MLITGIRSRPTYTTLVPDLAGRYHLLTGQGSGGAALLRLLQALPETADFHVIYASESRSGKDFRDELRRRCRTNLSLLATQGEAVAAVDRTLSGCKMGTRLYVAGSESFIGSIVQTTARYNLNADEVQRERCGSSARRVYCVHCRTSNEDVTTNIVKCVGCARNLLVRDHYSRRLGAYMGVMADAETPGVLPPIVEVFA